jgi:DNA polymerase II small subunit
VTPTGNQLELKRERDCEREVRIALSSSLSAGFHIDVEAFNFLTLISKTQSPAKLIEATLSKLQKLEDSPLFISRDILEETAEEIFPEKEESNVLTKASASRESLTGKLKNAFIPRARDIQKDVVVLEDPTTKTCSTGSIDEYLACFKDRFQRMTRLLRRRMDSRDAMTIKDAFRAAPKTKVKIIAMVTEKRESHHGVFLRVEDLQSSTTVLIPRNSSRELREQARLLLPDQVICLSLTKSRRGLLIAQELFFPDIPRRKPAGAKEEVYAALISDLHVGSRECMESEFARFLLWLNGKYGNKDLRDVAGLVKYVVIAGDVVDGIGIYPNQVDELEVLDVFEQYKKAAGFIEQIPDYIEVIVIPGNHDASRKALPQPALPKDYAEPLFEKRDIISLGNPSTISLHGVECLVYHGRSLDDVLATAADMDFHSPERAMRLMLRSRHLAPSYGQRTLIAPESRDFLVIERIPDILHAGHVHVMKHCFYNGTLLVNSGAWQGQTSYQRNLGLEPTPGIVPVVNLKTLAVTPIDFT